MRDVVISAIGVFLLAPFIGPLLAAIVVFVILMCYSTVRALRRRHDHSPDHDGLANSYKYDP